MERLGELRVDGEVFFLKATEQSKSRSGFGLLIMPLDSCLVVRWAEVLVFFLLIGLVDEGLPCEVLACRKSPITH